MFNFSKDSIVGIKEYSVMIVKNGLRYGTGDYEENFDVCFKKWIGE